MAAATFSATDFVCHDRCGFFHGSHIHDIYSNFNIYDSAGIIPASRTR